MNVSIQILLPIALRDAVDQSAKIKHVSRSSWIRAAVSLVLASQERAAPGPGRGEGA